MRVFPEVSTTRSSGLEATDALSQTETIRCSSTMTVFPDATVRSPSNTRPPSNRVRVISDPVRVLAPLFGGIAQDDFEPGSCHAPEVTEMMRPKPYKAESVATSAWADGGRIESTRSHGIEANSGLATSSPLMSDVGRRRSLEVLAEVSRFSRKSDMGRRGFINGAGVGRRGEQGVQLLAQTA